VTNRWHAFRRLGGKQQHPLVRIDPSRSIEFGAGFDDRVG